MLERREFYIGGAWVAPRDGRDHEVIDPSTETACAVISLGGQADTDAAVAAATAAFPDWSQSSRAERLNLLCAIAAEYRRRSDDLALAMTMEMGAPREWSRAVQVGAGLSQLNSTIAALEGFAFERMLRADAPADRILLEPVGVCGMITPWNWPMNQVVLKVAPALAAGCTMVLKPSEEAPLSSMVFAEVLDAAGVPAGVFNLVNGDGAGVGSQISAHPGIDMVSFTGSTRAGRAISVAAAGTLKRVTLELGGKGANIVFADADPKAVMRGARQCFNNTGQSCNAPTRMLVERSRYDEAVAEATAVARTTEAAEAHRAGRHIGPMVNAAQWDKVQALIETGIREGARLVAGGPGRPEGAARGFLVRPTVFADVDNAMTIVREEIFGPVLSILPFDTEEEAIAIANDTPYGLTNYVQTADGARANRVARRMRSGMVEINGIARSPGSPFGGMKMSGHGREGGVWGIEDYLEVKSVGGWAEE